MSGNGSYFLNFGYAVGMVSDLLVEGEETDEAIAIRVQSGDMEAFGLLIERFEAKLLRYARKFLLNTDDAKDLVQDVFIKAYEHIQSFDTTRRFSPWIYRIAHNEFINEIKKRQSRKTIFTFDMDLLIPHLSSNETSDSVAIERDTRAMLDRYLEKLDAKYREPLVLYYLEEMDYKEIAEILHIPVSTVGVRLARGRIALQKVAHKELP